MEDRWLELLVDPVDHQPLCFDGRNLVAINGIRYPIIDGIPVLLRTDVLSTHRGALRTLRLAEWSQKGGTIDLLTALNTSDGAKAQIRQEIAAGSDAAEAVIPFSLTHTRRA